MWQTFVIMHPLSLLLLLFQRTLQFQRNYSKFILPDSLQEDFEYYFGDFFGTGATIEPSKENFKLRMIVIPERSIFDDSFCSDAIMFKNIHNKFHCVEEHYFLQEPYEEIKKICSYSFTNCKNGIRKCNRSKKVMDGLYCKLETGTRIPDCRYQSFYRRGLALITCKWQNKIGELVPFSVEDISMPYGN
ncbi:inactive ribonuclease-like protein 9 [Orycteropus afer afer]|uniref:Inactive ribonuclease-like protein 9 n=1 Tax=Orycteropus afer afer TaxID=1230840 RepID=A0A8B7AT07_ORYAF|nr:inactive ribonuclease-like protein 9 [Orycteropus afer afer]